MFCRSRRCEACLVCSAPAQTQVRRYHQFPFRGRCLLSCMAPGLMGPTCGASTPPVPQGAPTALAAFPRTSGGSQPAAPRAREQERFCWRAVTSLHILVYPCPSLLSWHIPAHPCLSLLISAHPHRAAGSVPPQQLAFVGSNVWQLPLLATVTPLFNVLFSQSQFKN